MSLPALHGKTLAFSSGIRNLQNFAALFPESDGFTHHFVRRCKCCRQLVGWGGKPNTLRAQHLARQWGLPYLALEDGFYRSILPGVYGEAPLSLILDDLGVYYDATKPSRLEVLLQDGGWQSSELLLRAETLIRKIRRHQLSKYNHAPPLSRELPGQQGRKVLVVDQTYGDCSVTLGCADQATFKQMLTEALEENPDADIIIKTHPDVNAGKKRGYFSAGDICSSRIHLLSEEVNPISLLEQVDKVYVVSSQLGFEALLCDKQVHCYGMPFYAGWGLTNDKQSCARRTAKRSFTEVFAAACILYPRYMNPETGQAGELEDVLEHLIRYARLRAKIPGKQIACENFYWWKRRFLRLLLKPLPLSLSFSACGAADPDADAVIVWGGQAQSRVRSRETNSVPLIGMEDGFVRSVGLGSDYVPPHSLVLDGSGIYFDPQHPSDLETIFQKGVFPADLIERAEALRRSLLAGRISKYSVGDESVVGFGARPDQKVLLVPGQVEDDLSILRGCIDIKTNLDLLNEVRRLHPDDYIVYKPHPDVTSKNRRGAVDRDELLLSCDEIVADLSMATCLDACDEVHTMTSLAGFEALLHGKQVETYGLPFYAGWGLTRDRHCCPRRTRKLSLLELIAGALIEYPLYIDPDRRTLISVERAVELISLEKAGQKTLMAGGFWRKRLRKFRGLLRWNFC